jgi:hypothetical protein
MTSRITNTRQQKKEERIVNLTYIGRHNRMPVVRELEADDGTTTTTILSINDPSSPIKGNDSPIHFVTENKDLRYSNIPNLVDPDGNYEEQLEATGAPESEAFFCDDQHEWIVAKSWKDEYIAFVEFSIDR